MVNFVLLKIFVFIDKARLDVAARGLWSTFERILADVRIFNPNSESYLAQTLAQLYNQHENKKRQYLNRVLQVEKGSFPPLSSQLLGEWHLKLFVS